MGFPGGPDGKESAFNEEGKESAFNEGGLCSFPKSGRFPGEGKVYPLQYFFLIKYKYIYFNWRLITLQYCSGFAIC